MAQRTISMAGFIIAIVALVMAVIVFSAGFVGWPPITRIPGLEDKILTLEKRLKETDEDLEETRAKLGKLEITIQELKEALAKPAEEK